MWIDTHTHLYDAESIDEQDIQIQQAIDAGVTKLFMPNCDSTTIAPMMAISNRFPKQCFSMIGLHPCYVKENYKEELQKIEALLGNEHIIAIGEVGLDYYWSRDYDLEQRMAFEQQIDWALAYQLPLIIHSRSSTKECLDIVRKKQNGSLKVLFHCYSGTLEEAKRLIDLGGYLGIGGVVTYKKNTLEALLKEVPLEKIVLETDAPYLAPVPYRGKKNQSAYIPIIGQKLAELYQVSLEQIAMSTTKTAQLIFDKDFIWS